MRKHYFFFFFKNTAEMLNALDDSHFNDMTILLHTQDAAF